LDDYLGSVKSQIKYAQDIAANENICCLIDMTIEQVREEFQVRKSEDIDAISDKESYDLLNDFIIGGMLFNEYYQGPDKIVTDKKEGYSLNDRKKIIAEILQIDWKPKGEAGVAPATAKRARDEDSDDDSDDDFDALMSPHKKFKSENH